MNPLAMSPPNVPVILLAALVSMSAVELLKDLTPLRYAFNRWAVQRWLWRGLDLQIRRSRQISAIARGNWLSPQDIFHPLVKTADSFDFLERRVVELAACGQRAALYRPEIAQIAGQLNLLAERLMDFPAEDGIVLRAIAGVSVERPKESRKEPDEDLTQLTNQKQGFRAALAIADAKAHQTAMPGETAQTMSTEAGELIDTRTRVTAYVQGRLNELQITGRTSWRIVLLALAIGIAIVVALSGHGTWLDGLLAGVMAPVAYELLSVLKRVARV